MAARANVTDDEHIVFLLSNVAKECQIVSVGAAAKRFSRLNKKYCDGAAATDNHENGSAEDTAQSKPAPKTATTKKANASGKGALKAEKASKSAPATAPLATGVTKKRSSNKKSQFTTAPDDQLIKSEEGLEDEPEDMSAFFNAGMAPYL
ncbi:hypothetical protein UA08_00729 [Talaromyces atroroseus]|uniref:Myb-like DNA-binding domain-containing protein n=1 Tax=Talaromyces atroroseus TaxID=1441469 RepID=A0A225ART0_TALAT|nr:hypothetical protein UA08_00729 [Talaromyces atroroseus]OKL64282.1 hypothetical protein UA08_00729 [Talaromyces atroroseus]